MGKASKWFRSLLGLRKSDRSSPATTTASSDKQPPKRRWSFVKSARDLNALGKNERAPVNPLSPADDGEDHAMAVAEATAAVAEAAVAAAHAAAQVVRLTSGGRIAASGIGNREIVAAVKIQSYFRAYLSRRALKALKALVKLQALVRGHIVRKQYAEELRRMQAILRVQARARALRTQIFESSQSNVKFSHLGHPGPATPEKSENVRKNAKHEQSNVLKRSGSRLSDRVVLDKEKMNYHYNMDERSLERVYSTRSGGLKDEGKSDKVLEMDTEKAHITPKRRNLFPSSLYPSVSDPNGHSFTTSKDSTMHHQAGISSSSCEVQSSSPLNYKDDGEESSYCTAENSPCFHSASSKGGSSMRGGALTPSRSDASIRCLSGYSDYPNYMCYTESSRAKVRSLSAPRQRPQLERSNTTKRFSVHGAYGEMRSSSTQRGASTLHANFSSKAYPGSGRLDRLGMPIGVDGVGYSGGLWNRY